MKKIIKFFLFHHVYCVKLGIKMESQILIRIRIGIKAMALHNVSTIPVS
jgi:hypothetical protein